jgi:uncharacterized protein YciI
METLTIEQLFERSKSRGYLGKKVYIVFTTPTNGLDPVIKNLSAHLEHQVAIERNGVLLAAGPHWGEDEHLWKGEGMFLIRAGSVAEAREIAAADPMHKSGARSFKVRSWLINEGALRLRVTFSDGKMVLD